METSWGVEGALAVMIRPPSSITTQSVKVPPISIPQWYDMHAVRRASRPMVAVGDEESTVSGLAGPPTVR